MRRIEIVGEATSRLSQQTRDEIPEIQWKQVVGMRNVLAQQYDRVDLRLAWETVVQTLPQLKQTFQTYL